MATLLSTCTEPPHRLCSLSAVPGSLYFTEEETEAQKGKRSVQSHIAGQGVWDCETGPSKEQEE